MKTAESRRNGMPRGSTFSVPICAFLVIIAVWGAPIYAAVDPADLTYVPAHNDFTGSTQYVFANSNGDVSPAAGSPSYSYNLHTQVISQTLSYGFTDALSLSIDLAHSYVDARYENVDGAETSARDSAAGASAALTYRLVSQLSGPFNLDLSAGNTGASAAVSFEGSDFAVLGRAIVYRSTGGTGFDPVLNTELTTPQVWGYATQLQGQYHLSSRWAFNFGATYTSAPFSNHTASIGDTSFRLDRADALTLGLAAVYHFMPNRFSIQVDYQHGLIGQRRDNYADSSQDILAHNQRADLFGLILFYRF